MLNVTSSLDLGVRFSDMGPPNCEKAPGGLGKSTVHGESIEECVSPDAQADSGNPLLLAVSPITLVLAGTTKSRSCCTGNKC